MEIISRKSFSCLSRLLSLQEQYLYIYDTLDEALMCGKTWFSVTEIAHKFKQKSQKNPITRVNEYQREYTVSFGMTEISIEFSFDVCLQFDLNIGVPPKQERGQNSHVSTENL